jgi:hypothetical protein
MRAHVSLSRSLLPLLASLVLIAGCAPAMESPSSPRVDSRVLTRDEIASANAGNLYEVVQRLRPQWLRQPRATSLSGPGMLGVVVYQGNTRLGGTEALRQLHPGYPAELRFLDGPQASNTLPGLGSRTVAGAIIIVLPS